MFKKSLCALLCLLMVFSLAACGSKKSSYESIDLVSANNTMYDEDGYFRDIKASDYIKLPDLDTIQITQSAIDAEIATILEEHPNIEKVDDKVIENGDVVNIDYVGYFGDEVFDGGSTDGKGAYVEVGKTEYIDTFIEQLIGHKAGETFDINVTFPDPYEPNTDYSGKQAKFVTTINFVNVYTDAEWNDAFVKATFEESDGVSTVDEALVMIKNDLAYEKILNEAEIIKEIPSSIVEWLIDHIVDKYDMVASMYGLKLEDYLTAYNIESVEALRKDCRESCEANAKEWMIDQALAEYFGYKITDEEIDAYIADMNAHGEDTTKEILVEMYGENYIKAVIMYNNLYYSLHDRVNIEVIESNE